jgi:hypothetical protein
MDLMHAFYEGALEFPSAFRDRDNWCQFRAGPVSVALSSRSKAAKGARGSLIVFDAVDVVSFGRLYGRQRTNQPCGFSLRRRPMIEPTDNVGFPMTQLRHSETADKNARF